MSVKTFYARTFHFVDSSRIFVSAHFIITSNSALGMFTNLCLVLLSPFADLPVPKFHFQLKKKTRENSRRKSYNLADSVRALAQLYALYSHRPRSFNQGTLL